MGATVSMTVELDNGLTVYEFHGINTRGIRENIGLFRDTLGGQMTDQVFKNLEVGNADDFYAFISGIEVSRFLINSELMIRLVGIPRGTMLVNEAMFLEEKLDQIRSRHYERASLEEGDEYTGSLSLERKNELHEELYSFARIEVHWVK